MIYISGRITKNKNWKEDFLKAEDYLKKKYMFKEIVNPLKLESQITIKKTYVNYMRNDIKSLIYCTHIYMLRGWWRSKGARLERHIAKVLGLGIIYQRRGDK